MFACFQNHCESLAVMGTASFWVSGVTYLWEVITDSIWQVRLLWKRTLRFLRWLKPTAPAPVFNKVLVPVEFPHTASTDERGLFFAAHCLLGGIKEPRHSSVAGCGKSMWLRAEQRRRANLPDKLLLATGACLTHWCFSARETERCKRKKKKKLEVREMKRTFKKVTLFWSPQIPSPALVRN